MASVSLWASLASAIGEPDPIEVDASTVRELLAQLREAYPAISAQLDRGVSVSIDGRLYASHQLAEIRPDSEVVLLPRLVGG